MGETVMNRYTQYNLAKLVCILTTVSLLSVVSIAIAGNRVHSAGNVRMNINDNGTIGNRSLVGGGVEDPEHPGEWAPQCEFPAGSEVQYLFQGGLWVGALIQAEGYEYPRVSVAIDGWVHPAINEFSAPPESQIIERSNVIGARDYLGNDIYSPDAVATQEFITTYYDTLTDPEIVRSDPVDSLHQPLGLRITQKSMVWSDADLADIVIVQWEIENIGDQFLKNIYLGYHIDGDVGSLQENTWHEDDLVGFKAYRYFDGENGVDSARINLAYIADNDGRPREVSNGNEFSSPGVSGVMMLDAPNPRLNTSFNWWRSSRVPDDYGPNWEDEPPGDWTNPIGTPMGDVKKYKLMKNRENDFDAVRLNDREYIEAHPQQFPDPDNPGQFTEEEHHWRFPENDDALPPYWADNIADGFDAKYLLSWGPLGVFDHVDQEGNRIYRLNPGESFTVTVAYICAEGFHDPNLAQPDNQVINPGFFNFSDLYTNAERAIWIHDHLLGIREQDDKSELPTTLQLSPAFPNPFNSTTIVSFQSPFTGAINASLVDESGREWTKWTTEPMSSGSGRFVVDGAGLSTGTYWLKVNQGGQTASTRLVLVK